MKPGNDVITFSSRGTVVSRNADGIAQYTPTVTAVAGCFMQPMALKDQVGDTEFAQATHRCISPAVSAVLACVAEDTLTDAAGIHYRVVGKKVFNDWNGRPDHVTVICQEQAG